MTPRDKPHAAQRAAGDAGSVFVESIIAAAIVAMALIGTFRVIADGANRDRVLVERREALLVARSRMAAVGSEIPLQPGQSAGASGALIWRVDVSPYGDSAAGSSATGLWKVAVSIYAASGGQRLIELDSLRVGPPA